MCEFCNDLGMSVNFAYGYYIAWLLVKFIFY